MMTPFKWLFISLFAVFLVFFVAYTASMQDSAVRTTAEAEALADSVITGLLRGEFDDNGVLHGNSEYMVKQEISIQLANSLSHAQKQHPYQIEFNYVFLDEDKRVTEDEKEIKMLHFQVFYKNEEGVIKGNAERTLALDQFNQ